MTTTKTAVIDIETFRTLPADQQWEAVNDLFDEALRALKRKGADALDRKIFVGAFNVYPTAETKFKHCLYVIEANQPEA